MGALINETIGGLNIAYSEFQVESPKQPNYFPATKYYDIYIFENGHLGDATRETAGWNGDLLNFPTNSSPWFVRGGQQLDKGNANGIFAYSWYGGGAGPDRIFRSALTAS